MRWTVIVTKEESLPKGLSSLYINIMGSHYRDSAYKIYVGYKENHSGGDLLPGESDPYGSREDGNITFEPDHITIEKGPSQETVGVDFDPEDHVGEDMYMIIVRYRDGDTFGSTSGHWHIEGIYLDKDTAINVVDSIKDDDSYDTGYFPPWKGYFASLESVELWATQLDEKTCTGIRWF